MNQKLRNLVQQLGEAIHESVSESEQIAGVVKDIRKQGFDVLLMLEATIGLNELEQQPVGLDPTSASARKSASVESRSGDETFTAQDLNFLKGLLEFFDIAFIPILVAIAAAILGLLRLRRRARASRTV